MTILTELRLALRSLLRTPGFALSAALTVALGVGLATGVFATAWSLLLAPLPLAEPDRLLAVYETFETNPRRPVAPGNFLDLRREAKTLAGAASFFSINQVLTGDGEPRRVTAARVSSQFFDLLGSRPAAGRFFASGESAPLAVVARRFWEEELGGGSISGRKLTLDGETFDIVGLAPDHFDLPQDTLVWTVAPRDVAVLGMLRELDPTTLRDTRYLGVYARLAPDATLEAANRELTAIGARLAATFPDENTGCGVRAYPLADDLGNDVSRPLTLLAGGAAAILLVACLNVAGLFLARALGHRCELAVRTGPGFSIEALRSRLRAVSAELVLDSERPLADVVAAATAKERLLGTLLAVFAALALALAGVGLYGLLALVVAERRRELGVRIAVGATAGQLRALVLKKGALQALVGAALGLPAALAGGRALASWLYGVSPADPVSLLGAVAALALVAFVASWLPARRAARVDPVEVLRAD